jgi:murein DD-endopeptidase MepM/ murein hydrolase activator NlpD
MGPFENKGLNQDHILGGPEQEVQGPVGASYSPMESLGAAFSGQAVDNLGIASGSVENSGNSELAMGALKADGAVFSGLSTSSTNKGTFTYIIQKGDTLNGIATNFGISLNALIQTNPKVSSGPIKVGQKLTIGGAVAKTASASLAAVSAVVATPKITLASADSSVPYFIQPTQGFNWGVLHGHNGVDIANKCGTVISAAAEGLVVPNGSCAADDGWNGGYGRCLTLKHPNGTMTLYAHMQKTVVELGDYVQQGQEIGEMGSTGKSTGCHLHFEVHGAANPFAKS